MIDWKEFRKEWLRQGLSNKTESAKQAQGQWNKLSNDKRVMAKKYAARFQNDFRNTNSKDTTMLHCCRYLRHEYFMNYEEEAGEEETGTMLKEGEPGFIEYRDHLIAQRPSMRSIYENRTVFVVPASEEKS